MRYIGGGIWRGELVILYMDDETGEITMIGERDGN